MKTIAMIARHADWQQALATGNYTQSTINSTLEKGGFIHCSTPGQALEIANHKYADQSGLLVLFIDADKVKSPIKFEGKTKTGIFPHIYGPLNIEAVYQTKPLLKDAKGKFTL